MPHKMALERKRNPRDFLFTRRKGTREGKGEGVGGRPSKCQKSGGKRRRWKLS